MPLMKGRLCCMAILLAAISLRGAETTRPASSPASLAVPKSARVISLDEAYDIAVVTDQSIRIAYEKIRIANLQPYSALTTIWPTFTGGGGWDRSRTRDGGGIFNTDKSSDLSFNYSQTFLDFGVFPAFHSAKLGMVAARLSHQFTIRQVLFGVVKAYYQVISDQGVVAVDQKTVDLAAQQLDVAQKRLNVGEVTPTDALNAQVTLEAAKVALIQARNTLLADRDTLGNILNLGGDNGYQVVMPPDYPTTIPPFEKLLAIGYLNREDLAGGNIAIEADIANKDVDITKYLPTISGAASDSYTNARSFSGPQTQVWDANVSVNIPFLTGGQREINLVTARDQVDIDRLMRDETAKTVEGDVRTAWLNAHSLQESLVSLHTQVDAAQKSYEDEVHEYQAGEAASVDVLTSLVNLNTSENSLAVQQYLYQVALRNIEQSAGVFQQGRVELNKVK
jgi:outer membrane protein TolC